MDRLTLFSHNIPPEKHAGAIIMDRIESEERMKNQPRNLLIPAISPAAQGPLYKQIVDGVKREISEGRLQAGQALPSFRNLAEELLVSLITVKRAYEDLEREGIIYRKQGLGTFISEEGAARNRDAKRRHAIELMSQAIREATDAGMKKAEIAEMIHRLIDDPKGGKPS